MAWSTRDGSLELIDRHVLSRSTFLLNLAGDVNDVPGRLVVAIAFLILKMVVLVAVVSAVAGVGQLHVGAPTGGAATSNGDQIDIVGPARRSVARVVRRKNITKETTQHRHGAGYDTQVALEDRQQDDVSNIVCRAKCQLCLFSCLLLFLR